MSNKKVSLKGARRAASQWLDRAATAIADLYKNTFRPFRSKTLDRGTLLMIVATLLPATVVLMGVLPYVTRISLILVIVPLLSGLIRRVRDTGIRGRVLVIPFILSLVSVAAIVITSLVVSGELREYPSDILVDPAVLEASMQQSAIAVEVAVIALIAYTIVLIVILTSRTDRFTGKRLAPALYLISSIVVMTSLSAGMVFGLLSVRDAIKEHSYQYQAPSDAIMTTGVFTPGVFSDSADSITSEFDNKVGKIDHLFDSYEKDSENELSSGVYVGPLFAQNLQSDGEIHPLVLASIVNTTDSDVLANIEDVSVTGKSSSATATRVCKANSISFVPVNITDLEAISTSDSVQLNENGKRVWSPMTDINKIVQAANQ